ncbi:MAG: hypothetical protein JNJ45_05820 [Chthonomonas sp.]|nr:hypothetical protein [Chthonomonas sp.]
MTDESGADVEIWDAVTAHAPCLFTHRLEPIIACYQPVCSRQRWSAMQKRIDRRRIWIQEIVITEDYSLTVRMTEDYQLSVPAISSPEHGDIFWVIYVGVGESLMCTSENRKPELLHFDGTGEYTVVNMGD